MGGMRTLHLLPMAWLALLLVQLSCTRPNPAYCDPPCLDGGQGDGAVVQIDAPPGCSRDEDCEGHCGSAKECEPCEAEEDCAARSDGQNHCDKSAGRCLSCVTNDHCANASPICSAGTCGPCKADDQCAAREATQRVGLCSEGSCLGEEQVAFVDKNHPQCKDDRGAFDAPFCDIQQAVDRADDLRVNAVLVLSGAYPRFSVEGLALSIIGRGDVRLTSSPGEPVVEIRGLKASVTLRGLNIGQSTLFHDSECVTCTEQATCILEEMRISNCKTGIRSYLAKYLGVFRSSIFANQKGIRTQLSDFEIVNNLIHDNNRGGESDGGAELGAGFSTTNPKMSFRYNTVFRNQAASSTSAAGVDCLIRLSLTSNIFWKNSPHDVSNACALDHSIVGESALAGDGSTNLYRDPKFVRPTSNPPDLHLLEGSPCIDAGLETATPGVDYDACPRSGVPDIGAYEFACDK
ncbi:MAG: right-handed parallel beta-helix repeat-containing protein [Deltaproteobacteria bacterium]|nr:right-handed parallel beta-helix repeat-containing protein [Deltaproteobacteria bacterium]